MGDQRVFHLLAGGNVAEVDLRGASQHPTLADRLFGRLGQVRQDHALEPRHGEQAGDRIAQGPPGGAHEMRARQGADRVGRNERPHAARRIRRSQQRIGAVCDADIRQPGLRARQQVRIGGDEFADRMGQQRVQMHQQARARRRQRGPGIGRRPVRLHPVAHHRLVHRPASAQDHIHPGGSVQRIQVVGPRPHARFQQGDQPRQQDALQGSAIGEAGSGRVLVPLRQPQPARVWRGLGHQGMGLVQQRCGDAHQIGSPDRHRIKPSGVEGALIGGHREVEALLAAGDVAGGQPERGDAAHGDGAGHGPGGGAQQPAAAGGAGIAHHQHGLAEHHLLQQGLQEVAAPRTRPQRRRLALVDAEAARQGAGQPVDRAALLRAGGEVDAAQEGRRIDPGAGEGGIDEGRQRRLQAGELHRKIRDRGPPLRAAFGLQPVDDAHRELGRQRLEFLRETAGGARVVALQREGHAPDLGPAVSVQVVEEIGKTLDQVELGEHHIDRDARPQLGGEFLDPAADCSGVGAPFGLRCSGDLADRDGHDHPVQRLARAGAAQQGQKPVPALLVRRGVGVLGGVAAGGVDQHRLIGEGPVAESGAADTFHLGGFQFGGEREAQAGIGQGGGLAGAGRADDHVPGLFVQVAAGAAGLAQQAHRPRQALALFGDVFRPRGGACGRGAPGDAGGEPLVGLAARVVNRGVHPKPDEGHQAHGGDARQPALHGGQQRAEQPDHGAGRDHPERGQDPAGGDGVEDRFHRSGTCG